MSTPVATDAAAQAASDLRECGIPATQRGDAITATLTPHQATALAVLAECGDLNPETP